MKFAWLAIITCNLLCWQNFILYKSAEAESGRPESAFRVFGYSDISSANYSGTIIECSDGEDVLSIGISSNFQTNQQRLGPIYAFRRTGPLTFEKLGRPVDYYGYYLSEFDGKAIAIPRVDAKHYYEIDDDGKFSYKKEFAEDPKLGRLRYKTANAYFYERGLNISGVEYLAPSADDFISLSPVYFSESLILWHGNKTKGRGLIIQDRKSNSFVKYKYRKDKEFPYAIWERGNGELILSTSTGTILLITGDLKIRMIEFHDESYQLYSALKTSEGTWLGHYPSGQLYFDDGRKIFRKTAIDFSEFDTKTTWEAQSNIFYNGSMLIGMWPFGHVFDYSSDEDYSFKRVMSGPAIDDPKNGRSEPYYGILGKNHFGQRVSDMLLHDGNVYISTSSKGGKTPPSEIPNADDYGVIWRASAPNNVSFPVPKAKDFDIELWQRKIVVDGVSRDIDISGLSSSCLAAEDGPTFGKLSLGLNVTKLY